VRVESPILYEMDFSTTGLTFAKIEKDDKIKDSAILSHALSVMTLQK